MQQTSLRFIKTQPTLVTLLFLALTFSFVTCAKRSYNSPSTSGANDAQTIQREANDRQSASSSSSASKQSTTLINLNTASEKELETLPGIGKGLAERIVEHREKF